MPFLRFSRDRRGYENFYIVHSTNRRGKSRPRILYWFRTPPNVKVGRQPFDDAVRQAIEAQNPGVTFDWPRLMETPIPPPVEPERWRERRRAERAAKEAAREEAAEEARAAGASAAEAGSAEPAPNDDAEPPQSLDTVAAEPAVGDAVAAAPASATFEQRARRRRRRGRRGRRATDMGAQPPPPPGAPALADSSEGPEQALDSSADRDPLDEDPEV